MQLIAFPIESDGRCQFVANHWDLLNVLPVLQYCLEYNVREYSTYKHSNYILWVCWKSTVRNPGKLSSRRSGNATPPGPRLAGAAGRQYDRDCMETTEQFAHSRRARSLEKSTTLPQFSIESQPGRQ
jgi:hypothetical protein